MQVPPGPGTPGTPGTPVISGDLQLGHTQVWGFCQCWSPPTSAALYSSATGGKLVLGATKPQRIVDLAGAEVRQPRGGHLSPCCQQEENVLRILVLSGPGGGEEELVLRARTLEERKEWMAGLMTVLEQEEATCPSGRETESIREESVRRETESIREESVKGETESVREEPVRRETESITEESVRGETESIREESVKGETELVSEKSTNQQVLALPEYKGSKTQTKKKQEERSITVWSNISGSPSWLGTRVVFLGPHFGNFKEATFF